jgi:hypothetical protein
MISRRIRRSALVAALVAVALGASSCSSTLNDAATVTYPTGDGTQTAHISQDELLDRVEASVSSPVFRQLATEAQFNPGDGETSTDSTLTAFWLSQMINEVVVTSIFEEGDLRTTPDGETQARQTVEQRFSADVVNSWPAAMQQDLVNTQARLNAVLGSCPSGRVASHVLVRTEAAAEEAYEQIRDGADFEAIARDKSVDEGSARLGGLLGCVGPDMFVPEFQKEAETAPLGVVGRPVKTEFGYHLVLVREWDPALLQDQQMAQGAAQAATRTLDKRLRDIDVHVDPRFGTWGLHQTPDGQEVFNVAAPAVPEPRTQREPAPATTAPLLQPEDG